MKLQQGLFWIGAIFCLVGIFLPWEIQGDPVLHYTYGLQLYPRLADHGGFEFLLLIVYLIYGTFMSPPPPQKAGLGYLMSAVLLVLSALYFTGRWFLHNILYTGVDRCTCHRDRVGPGPGWLRYAGYHRHDEDLT